MVSCDTVRVHLKIFSIPARRHPWSRVRFFLSFPHNLFVRNTSALLCLVSKFPSDSGLLRLFFRIGMIRFPFSSATIEYVAVSIMRISFLSSFSVDPCGAIPSLVNSGCFSPGMSKNTSRIVHTVSDLVFVPGILYTLLMAL